MWRKAWVWAIAHLRTEDDDWREVVAEINDRSHDRPPVPSFDERQCPKCGHRAKHRLWTAQPEGKLFTCRKDECQYAWVSATTGHTDA